MSEEKEIVVCLNCGISIGVPENLLVANMATCPHGGLHDPTQTVSVIPAELAEELVEALSEIAGVWPGEIGTEPQEDWRMARAREALHHYRQDTKGQPSEPIFDPRYEGLLDEQRQLAEGLERALEPVAAEARRLEADGLLEVQTRGDDPALTYPTDIDLSVADLRQAREALRSYKQAMGETE